MLFSLFRRLIAIGLIIGFSFIDLTLSFATEPDIKIISSDKQEILFPSYLSQLSPAIDCDRNPNVKYEVKGWDSAILKIIKQLIEKLPEAARENGEPVLRSDINKDTLYVHSLVSSVMNEKLSKLSNQDLDAIFEFAECYGINPLLDAIALAISQRVDTSLIREDITLQTLLNKQGFYYIHESKLERIQNYIKLNRANIKEKSLMDEIAVKGKKVATNKTLNLSFLGLTSLKGIELIPHADEIETIDLKGNPHVYIDSTLSAELLNRYTRLKSIVIYEGQEVPNIFKDKTITRVPHHDYTSGICGEHRCRFKF